MKPFLKAISFLVILTILDFILRKGFLGFYLPFQLPVGLNGLLLYTLFAVCSWLVTKWFAKSDGESLNDLGISLNPKNRLEFLYGFLIGAGLWGIVSIVQAYTAGFAWEFRPDASLYNLLYGLLFIFIADLGTELFTRGYPLLRLKDSVGEMAAIIIMAFIVGMNSFSPEIAGELLFYTILIPALHVVFFSLIYFKTKRLGGALGVHVGANFVTISIFDLRVAQAGQSIPSGIFQPGAELETLSLAALQLPWILMVIGFSVVVYLWRGKGL